jgi:hypothetical protein
MAILNFRGHTQEVETLNNQEFTAPVVRVVNSNSYWYRAYLEDGSIVQFILPQVEDSFKFINCLLKYKGHELHVLLKEEEFPDSSIVSISFTKRYCKAVYKNGEAVEFRFFKYEDSIPFRDNFPLEKYKAALAAKTMVEQAIFEYQKEMEKLGAVNCYDSTESWLEIEDIPDYEWNLF